MSFVKQVILLLAGSLGSSLCNAGLVSEEFHNGSDLLRSYYSLFVENLSVGDGSYSQVSGFPLIGDTSASITDATAHDHYEWSADRLLVKFERHEKSGNSRIDSHGVIFFSVTQAQTYELSGGYLLSASASQEVALRATWEDMTLGTLLYDSYQADSAAAGSYQLGGLQGSGQTILTGSAANQLLPSHVYRLSWAASMDNRASASSDALAFGQMGLAAVPEPAISVLLLAGLTLVLRAARRASPRMIGRPDRLR